MRYIIGFFITIGLIIFLIVLLFSGGKAKPKVAPRPSLSSYASSDAVARMITDGVINSQQNHERIQISVGRDQVVYEEIKGYDGQVVNRQTYPNSQNSYSAFLHALAVAGFTHGDPSPALHDEVGYCPLGDRYIFEFIQNGQDHWRYWTTSCGTGTPKTYLGGVQTTTELFQKQVPNYLQLTQNIQFYQ